MGSSRCLYYFSVFMCKTGLFQPKVESRQGLDIALIASFTPRIGILILMWCSCTITIDEQNDIIAGDIKNELTKCPAIQNLTELK